MRACGGKAFVETMKGSIKEVAIDFFPDNCRPNAKWGDFQAQLNRAFYVQRGKWQPFRQEISVAQSIFDKERHSPRPVRNWYEIRGFDFFNNHVSNRVVNRNLWSSSATSVNESSKAVHSHSEFLIPTPKGYWGHFPEP